MKERKIFIFLILIILVVFLQVLTAQAKGLVKNKQSTCIGPTITVGTVSACSSGSTVEVPITINDIAGETSCTFAVSFDNTKLQYTGKTSGDMGADILLGKTEDINGTGKVQPIVMFEEGGATSGTICKFKFTLLVDIEEGSSIDLPISEINSPHPGTFCGEDGAVECRTSTPQTWDDVVAVYQGYLNGNMTWDEVLAAYYAYISYISSLGV